MFRHDLRQKGGKASSKYCSWGTTHLTKAKAATRALSLSRNRSRNAATKSTVGPSEHKSQKRFRRNRRRKVGGVHDLDGRALTSCSNSRKSYGVKWGKKEIARSEASERYKLSVHLGRWARPFTRRHSWHVHSRKVGAVFSSREENHLNCTLFCLVSLREKHWRCRVSFFPTRWKIRNNLPVHPFFASVARAPLCSSFILEGEKEANRQLGTHLSGRRSNRFESEMTLTRRRLLPRPGPAKTTKPKLPKNGYRKISQQLTSVWGLFKVEMDRRIIGGEKGKSCLTATRPTHRRGLRHKINGDKAIDERETLRRTETSWLTESDTNIDLHLLTRRSSV